MQTSEMAWPQTPQLLPPYVAVAAVGGWPAAELGGSSFALLS